MISFLINVCLFKIEKGFSGDADGDSYENIGNIMGSCIEGDVLIGNSGPNIITTCGQGRATIYGGGGNDKIVLMSHGHTILVDAYLEKLEVSSFDCSLDKLKFLHAQTSQEIQFE